jgi:hypothetical protein
MGVIDWLKKAFGPEQKEPPLPRRTPQRPRGKTPQAAPEQERPEAGTEYPVKRRYERFVVEDRDLTAKAALADIIELCNISTVGCCIVTTKTLKPGDNVLLKLPHEKVSSPLKCTIIWERADEEAAATGGEAANLRKAGLKFSDLDTGTLVRIKDFMRLVGIPSDQKLEDGLRPSPLRYSIFTHEKAKMNYPSTFPVKKISLGGMLVETESDLDAGERYPMALYLSEGDRPVRFRGRVASKVPSGKGFDIGVEFCDMSDDDRDRLASFISALTQGR